MTARRQEFNPIHITRQSVLAAGYFRRSVELVCFHFVLLESAPRLTGLATLTGTEWQQFRAPTIAVSIVKKRRRDSGHAMLVAESQCLATGLLGTCVPDPTRRLCHPRSDDPSVGRSERSILEPNLEKNKKIWFRPLHLISLNIFIGQNLHVKVFLSERFSFLLRANPLGNRWNISRSIWDY